MYSKDDKMAIDFLQLTRYHQDYKTLLMHPVIQCLRTDLHDNPREIDNSMFYGVPLDQEPQTMLGGQSSGINTVLFVEAEAIADRDGTQEAGEAPKGFV